MAISHVYSHLMLKNGNFILLMTCSGQEWQFHSLLLKCSAQEWQFHISNAIMKWSRMAILYDY